MAHQRGVSDRFLYGIWVVLMCIVIWTPLARSGD